MPTGFRTIILSPVCWDLPFHSFSPQMHNAVISSAITLRSRAFVQDLMEALLTRFAAERVFSRELSKPNYTEIIALLVPSSADRFSTGDFQYRSELKACDVIMKYQLHPCMVKKISLTAASFTLDLRFFLCYTFILLPPREPHVFVRLSRWQ